MRAWLVFRGALGLVLGGLILLQPTLSLDAFALAVGVFFVIGGVARVVVGAAETHYAAGLRVLNVVVGALLVALGAASIRYPGFGLVATVAIIGFAWMMEGAATLAVLPPRHRGRGWAIAFGAVSLLAGAVVIVWPWAWLLPLLIVVGAALAVGGVFDIARAAKLRPGWGRRSVE
ncbi:MAG: DUF308 domain-containing protein [Bifidobacteriaceae bacterium]|jgi:uncharacterized membrane protein HdeD (DUF308 family)|nr:DUF308 domain-containing protein [Bifidobacteriaceae bacterium]